MRQEIFHNNRFPDTSLSSDHHIGTSCCQSPQDELILSCVRSWHKNLEEVLLGVIFEIAQLVIPRLKPVHFLVQSIIVDISFNTEIREDARNFCFKDAGEILAGVVVDVGSNGPDEREHHVRLYHFLRLEHICLL